jgi:fructose-bisphosphate aldolase class II
VAIVSSAEAFEWAEHTGRSVAAFNAITLEHAQAIVWGAEASDAPVIVQLSENAIAYQGDAKALAAAIVSLAESSSASVALHLDHITDGELARTSTEWGFSSLMWDSSALEFEANVSTTRDMVQWAHARGVWVEAELGEIGGKDGAHAPGVRTNPAEAKAFVEATHVDALAVAVGSSHAMSDKSASLDLGLIAEIHEVLSVPLVLHGSSGVPDDMLRDACAAGITKVNIGTALNQAATAEIRRVLGADAALSDPRRYLGPARDAMKATVEHYVRVVSGS